MIIIRYIREHHQTLIKHVDQVDNVNQQDDQVFDLDYGIELIYLLVETNDDDCCCSGSTECVIDVVTDWKQAVDHLLKPNTDNYQIRSYRLIDQTHYQYDKSYHIYRETCECDQANYHFVWLCDNQTYIPFPDQTPTQFEQKKSTLRASIYTK